MNTSLKNYLFLCVLLSSALFACGDDSNSDTNPTTSNTSTTSTTSTTSAQTSTSGTTEPAQFVFPNEEVACQPNTAYEAQRSILAGGKNNPTGRGEQSGVYDPCNARIVLFGGNDRQPEECDSFGAKNYLGDTWAYSLEYENWYRINLPTAPSARGRHATALDLSRKRMLIFGGRFLPAGETSGTYTLFNDLWSFDINTDTWTEVQATGDIPSKRTNSAMVYDENGDRFILFGGNSSTSGTAFRPLDDTYVFDPKTNTWTEVQSPETPAPRLFHAMVFDSTRNQVLLYSGGDENAFFGDFLNDVWALDLETLTWDRIWGVRINNPLPSPLPRINSTLVEDRSTGTFLLFGGHDDGALGNTNDLWSFNPDDSSWTLINEGDVYTGAGCPSFCQCAEDFVTYDLNSPERRQYHLLVPVRDQNTAILFGGTGDCGYMDDTWNLSLSDGSWTETHAAEQGIACARTGRSDCEELCY